MAILTAGQTALLVRRAKAGDVRARNLIVESNLGLVHLVVRRLAGPRCSRDLFADLCQEGALGLVRAIETFEPDREVKFATYGSFWVRAFARRHLRQGRSIIWSETPRPADARLDAPLGSGGDDSRTLEDSLTDPAPSQEEALEAAQDRAEIARQARAAVGDVHERPPSPMNRKAVARAIAKTRTLAQEPATLEALAARFSVSKTTIQNVEFDLHAAIKRRLVG